MSVMSATKFLQVSLVLAVEIVVIPSKLGKELLIEHTKTHSLKSVKCDDCGKEFSRKYHLDRHIGPTGCMGLLKQVYDCRVIKNKLDIRFCCDVNSLGLWQIVYT